MKSYLYKILFKGRFLPKKLAEVLDDFEARLSHLEEQPGLGLKVSIKVADRDGNPIKGAKVKYDKPDGTPDATTDDNGEVVIPNVQRNNAIKFSVSCTGYEIFNWVGQATSSVIRINLKKAKK